MTSKMSEPFGGFDWDGGNREKCVRHGVTIVEIEALFAGDFRVAPDLKHADVEARFMHDKELARHAPSRS